MKTIGVILLLVAACQGLTIPANDYYVEERPIDRPTAEILLPEAAEDRPIDRPTAEILLPEFPVDRPDIRPLECRPILKAKIVRKIVRDLLEDALKDRIIDNLKERARESEYVREAAKARLLDNVKERFASVLRERLVSNIKSRIAALLKDRLTDNVRDRVVDAIRQRVRGLARERLVSVCRPEIELERPEALPLPIERPVETKPLARPQTKDLPRQPETRPVDRPAVDVRELIEQYLSERQLQTLLPEPERQTMCLNLISTLRDIYEYRNSEEEVITPEILLPEEGVITPEILLPSPEVGILPYEPEVTVELL